MFYPGQVLPQAGVPALAGPVSSIRMKMLRRGLQDYEYLWLVRQIGRATVAAESAAAARAVLETFPPKYLYVNEAAPGPVGLVRQLQAAGFLREVYRAGGVAVLEVK